MKLSLLIPEKIRKVYFDNIKVANIRIHPEDYLSRSLIYGFWISAFFSIILFLLNVNFFLVFIISFLLFQIIAYYRVSLKASAQIRKMEEVFPDLIQLMASNLRVGMTIDRAFLFSARPEFEPLDKEVLLTGKEIATGKEIVRAFNDLSKRINSEKIGKIISLIISGLKAGGNISTLLETAGQNMREKEYLEKRAASNVLMYVIFIFIAVGIGAPFLFALSSILVEIIIGLTSKLSVTSSAQTSLPFTFTNVGLSINFVIYFALVFLVTIDVISSLLIGLVNKGSEKYGLRYALPLIITSLSMFFLIRLFLYNFISSSFDILS